MVQLISVLEGVPVTQDIAGARGELGHRVPSPVLPPLGRKGRSNPSSPDVDKLQARCQLHCSTHLHMLEAEGRCSVATDRTRNCRHDKNTHFVTLLSQNISSFASMSECTKCLSVSHRWKESLSTVPWSLRPRWTSLVCVSRYCLCCRLPLSCSATQVCTVGWCLSKWHQASQL